MLLQETHFRHKDTHRLKVRRWIKFIIKDKERFIIIKGSIQEEDITFINKCALNIGLLKYREKILSYLKRENNSNTIIVGDVNIYHTLVTRSSRLKINKESLDLNDTLDWMNIVDVYRISPPKKTTDYTFLSNVLGTMEQSPRKITY